LCPKAWHDSRVQRVLALLDVLLGCAARVVELHCPLVGSGQIGQDEAEPRGQPALVPLDLGDHPTGAGPAVGLVVEAGIGHDRLLGRRPTGRVRSWPIRRCNTSRPGQLPLEYEPPGAGAAGRVAALKRKR
jgi:hypothetical protein